MSFKAVYGHPEIAGCHFSLNEHEERRKAEQGTGRLGPYYRGAPTHPGFLIDGVRGPFPLNAANGSHSG